MTEWRKKRIETNLEIVEYSRFYSKYATVNPCDKALGHASNNLEVVLPSNKIFRVRAILMFC